MVVGEQPLTRYTSVNSFFSLHLGTPSEWSVVSNVCARNIWHKLIVHNIREWELCDASFVKYLNTPVLINAVTTSDRQMWHARLPSSKWIASSAARNIKTNLIFLICYTAHLELYKIGGEENTIRMSFWHASCLCKCKIKKRERERNAGWMQHQNHKNNKCAFWLVFPVSQKTLSRKGGGIAWAWKQTKNKMCFRCCALYITLLCANTPANQNNVC